MEDRGPSAYIAEFLGTLLLVFVVGMIVSVHQVGTVGLGYQDFAVIGLVHLLVLALLIASLAPASGGYFNPAVTLGFAVLGRIRGPVAAVYVLVQIVAAVLAALLVRALLPDAGPAGHYGAPVISEHFLSGSAIRAFACELIGTFLLMWAYVSVMDDPRADRSTGPWIIGGALGLGVMVFGPLTGGALNPARALGPALVGDAFGAAGTWLLAFVVGPVVGALLAVIGHRGLAIRTPGPPPGAARGPRPRPAPGPAPGAGPPAA